MLNYICVCVSVSVYISIYRYMNHFAGYLKLTHYQSTTKRKKEIESIK